MKMREEHVETDPSRSIGSAMETDGSRFSVEDGVDR